MARSSDVRLPPILAAYASKPDVRFRAAAPLDRTAAVGAFWPLVGPLAKGLGTRFGEKVSAEKLRARLEIQFVSIPEGASPVKSS